MGTEKAVVAAASPFSVGNPTAVEDLRVHLHPYSAAFQMLHVFWVGVISIADA